MRGIKLLSTLIAVVFMVSTVIAAPVEVNRFALLGEEIAARAGNPTEVRNNFQTVLTSEAVQKLLADGKLEEAYNEFQKEFAGLPSSGAKRDVIIAALNGVVALKKAGVADKDLPASEIKVITDNAVISGNNWAAAIDYALRGISFMFGPGHEVVFNEAKKATTLDKPEVVINGITVKLNSKLYTGDNIKVVDAFVKGLDNEKYNNVSFYPGLYDSATIDGTTLTLILPETYLVNTADEATLSPELGLLKLQTAKAGKFDVFKKFFPGLNDVDLAVAILNYYVGHEELEQAKRAIIEDPSLTMKEKILKHYEEVVVPHEKAIGKTGLWLELYGAVGAQLNADVYNEEENAATIAKVMEALKANMISSKVGIVVSEETLSNNDFMTGTLLGLQLKMLEKDKRLIVVPANASKAEIDKKAAGVENYVFLDIEGSKTYETFRNTANTYIGESKKGLFATLDQELFATAEGYDPLDFVVNFPKVIEYYVTQIAKSTEKGLQEEIVDVNWFNTFIKGITKIALTMTKIQETAMRQRIITIAA
ncbi:MAG: hypothetical protein JW938_05025 [Candidatus Omnitrophica bacterium]|nr:hypothetical protein [Candidatus Omnitrophota bacterium]